MKKLYLILFLFSSFFHSIFSQDFEFTPININFRSIDSKGDTIAVLGDFGSMLISYNNAETWKQIRVFEKGKMVKLFFEDSSIIAFNDIGQINISKDNGKTWENKADFNDSVFSVILYPEGYFLRSDSNLKIISNDYKIIKEYTLYSKPLGSAYKHEYRKSLAFFKNNLIAAIDSARFLRFNVNLELIDTFDLRNIIGDSLFYSYYQIELDSNNFYSKVEYKIYKTSDFNTAEIAFDSADYYKLIEGKIYCIYFPVNYYPNHENFILTLYKVIDKESSIKISELEDTYVTANIKPKDFTIVNDKLIIVGNKKLILTLNLGDNKFNVVSDFSSGNNSSVPDLVNDSTFYFYSGLYYGTFYNHIYKTINNFINITPVVDSKLNPMYKNYDHFQFKYFDDISNIIYIGGSNNYFPKGSVLISSDNGQSFLIKELPEFNFNYFIPVPPFLKFWQIPNIQRNNNNFMLLSNNFYYKAYTKIFIYNSNFDLVSMYKDSNYLIDYIYSKDTNSYLIHCINYIDTTREIRFSSDKGSNWELIKKYPEKDSVLYYKEIKINNKPALAMFILNYSDSIETIEMMDLESGKIDKIYSYKLSGIKSNKPIENGISSINDTIYIVIKDTLFYTKNIYDRSKWKYIIFPNNGKIKRTFAKYADKFFASYSDDIHPDNIYWINITDFDKPKPLISATDYDFGKRDIKSIDTNTASLRIVNPSQDAELLITGYSILTESTFTTDLPIIDSMNTLVIKPGEYYEFNVKFKPIDVKTYSDSINFYSNATGNDNIAYLRGEGIDTTTDVIDVSVEVQNYLYAYPPFPMPAKNYVKTLIYWDLSLDIDNDEIAVYNIYGEKISGRERIRIDRQNSYSGWLVWECSDVDSGIYFIKVNHGTRTLYLKVMVDR